MLSHNLVVASAFILLPTSKAAPSQDVAIEKLVPQISGDPSGFSLEAINVPSNASQLVSRDGLPGLVPRQNSGFTVTADSK